MRLIQALTVIIVCCFSLLQNGMSAEPPTTAVPAPVKVTSVEGITEYQLSNGLKVLLFPDPSKPTITVAITYLVGSRHENYGESGMAHLLEHLVFKPTKNYSGENGTKTPKDILDSMGANFNGTTSYDRTNYFITFPATAENLKTILDLEAERMVNCMVGVDSVKAAEQLKTEMTVVRNEFEAGKNSPIKVTMAQTIGVAFDWSNYGKSTIGCKSDIENVDVERLGAFYRKYYQPDNAVLLVAGKIDQTKTLAKINEIFGRIPKPIRKLKKTYTVEPEQNGERLVTVRRVGDTPAVMIVYKTPAGSDESNASFRVLSSIMTSQPSGRLYKALVESKKAAMVFSYPASTAKPGYIFYFAQLSKGGNVDEVRKCMTSLLENIAKKPITEEEVERARRKILTNTELYMKNSSSLGIGLSSYIALGDWRMFFINRDRVKAVTPESVQKAATTYLKRSNRTVGQFIPTKTPDRVDVPAVKDVAALVKNYKGKAPMAQGEDFDTTPAIIEQRIVRFAIPPGLKCAVVLRKTRGHVIVATIRLHLGKEKALRNKQTIGSLCASMLMRGTKNHTRQQLKDEFDRLKAQVYIGGSAESLYVWVKTEKDNFAEVMKLVAEILRQPSFPAKELDILINQNIAMIDNRRAEPSAQAYLVLRSHMRPYSKEHVRYCGSFDEDVQALKSAKINDVKTFHAAFYGGTGEMAIVGEVKPAKMKQLVNNLFGDWKPVTPYVRIPSRIFAVKPMNRSLETPDKANAFFLASFAIKIRDDNPDYPALMFANYMLGGGTFKNRLIQRMREKDGMSYGASSRLSVSNQDEVGTWTAYAILNPANIQKLEAAFNEEISKALKYGFTAREIAAAKQSWIRGRIVARAQESRLAGMLTGLLVVDRTLAFEANLEKKVAALDNKKIMAVMDKYFDPGKILIVKAGDFKNSAKAKNSAIIRSKQDGRE